MSERSGAGWDVRGAQSADVRHPASEPPLPESPFSIVFGPVPSRRLGRSLGINNIPPKVCSYSCVYCQVGRTDELTTKRRHFRAPSELIETVRLRLEECRHAGEQVDYATFVSDGEPTLDAGLGEEIRGVRELGVRVAVINNGSLLWRDDVRADLAAADWVSAKVDTVDEGTWRRINRPTRDLDLDLVLDGIATFASGRAAEFVTETMLVASINDDDRSLEATARFLSRTGPAVAYISAPIRPPAEAGVRMPSPETLVHAREIFAGAGLAAELLAEDEPDEFATAEGVESGLLSIMAVHPMREAAVREYLSRSGADWSLVERLLASGSIVAIVHRGQQFYTLPANRGRAVAQPARRGGSGTRGRPSRPLPPSS